METPALIRFDLHWFGMLCFDSTRLDPTQPTRPAAPLPTRCSSPPGSASLFPADGACETPLGSPWLLALPMSALSTAQASKPGKWCW